MKKLTIIFFFLFSIYGTSQELMNFYLEPNTLTSGSDISLRTTFYHYHGAGLISFEYTVDGYEINVTLCYGLGSTASETIDHKVFDLNLPEGNGNYTINIDLISSYTNDPCTTYIESGSLSFEYPYNPIEKIEIPDDLFEKNLEYLNFGDGIEDNDMVFKHRIENIKSLYIRNFYPPEDLVENLIGIKFFRSLKRLRCQGNLISHLDFTHNTELEYLWCQGNLNETMNVSNCLKLKELNCGNPNLTSLDVSNNVLLEELSVYGDSILELDLSNNVNLVKLDLGAPQLSELNLTFNTHLEEINVYSSNLSELDLDENPSLEKLSLSNNSISELDLSCNPNIIELDIGETNLASLDLSINTLIRELRIDNNFLLTHLNTSDLFNLETVYCYNNNINDLDFSNCENLYHVFLLNNGLHSLSIKNGNNENIDFLFTMNNPDLFCIEVDEVIDPMPFNYQIDSHTEFSTDCPD